MACFDRDSHSVLSLIVARSTRVELAAGAGRVFRRAGLDSIGGSVDTDIVMQADVYGYRGYFGFARRIAAAGGL